MANRQTNRRSFFTTAGAFLASFGIGAASSRTGSAASPDSATLPPSVTNASAQSPATSSSSPANGPTRASTKEVVGTIVKTDDEPLFSSAVVHGDLVYIAGKGAHFEGDIKAHTDHVLNELEKELEEAGSSMENVLKVNVYLHDIHDYTEMNEVYRGRFGDEPPVRTTVACFGGVPGDSLVEIDCIAALNS